MLGAPRIRAVKKERKHYHLDWTVVPEDAARFENLVACHLLKWVHFGQDTKGRDLELRYFRDITGREVDFVVVEGRHPRLLVECKWGDTAPDRSLLLKLGCDEMQGYLISRPAPPEKVIAFLRSQEQDKTDVPRRRALAIVGKNKGIKNRM